MAWWKPSTARATHVEGAAQLRTAPRTSTSTSDTGRAIPREGTGRRRCKRRRRVGARQPHCWPPFGPWFSVPDLRRKSGPVFEPPGVFSFSFFTLRVVYPRSTLLLLYTIQSQDNTLFPLSLLSFVVSLPALTNELHHPTKCSPSPPPPPPPLPPPQWTIHKLHQQYRRHRLLEVTMPPFPLPQTQSIPSTTLPFPSTRSWPGSAWLSAGN